MSLSEMFSTELKFAIDILVKWFNGIFKSRFKELSEIEKQKFLEENSCNLSNEKCVIYDQRLGVNGRIGYEKERYEKTENLTTWYNLLFKKNPKKNLKTSVC